MRKWVKVALVLILVAVMIWLVVVFFSDSDAGKGRITDAKKPSTEEAFGGGKHESAQSVQQTADGGYIIAGYTYSYGAGEGDAYLVKTDGKRNEEWYRTFGGDKGEYAYSVQQTADGGYIIAGNTYSYSPGVGDRYAYLVKTDGEGNLEWHRTFGGEQDDSVHSVRQTADGGYIIAGYTYAPGVGGADAYLVKTDGEGNEEWYQTFGGDKEEYAQSVRQTADGGYIIAGHTKSYGAGERDAYLVKTDGKGNEEWYRTFGGDKPEYAYSVEQTADGGYIIAGHTYSYGAGERDAYLVKTDGKGNEEWYRTFGGEDNDIAYSVRQTFVNEPTVDGGYIIAGETHSYGAGERDAYLVKTDGKGNEKWYRTFGGENDDVAYSVEQTADGGYIIAGETHSYGAGGRDAYLVKTDGEGRGG